MNVRKGQLTAEYLFLALVSLALIAISLGALSKIQDAGKRVSHLELFKSSSLDIYNAGEEVCAMGSGNTMRLKISENVSISRGEGGRTVFSNQILNVSVPKKTLCEYSGYEALSGSEITVANEGGTITLSPA